MRYSKVSLASGLFLAGNVLAIELNLGDASSIRDAAKTIAESIINRYHNGSDIPGLFGEPYYFWESGLAWDSLIHYWHQTGDDSYNDIIGEALRWQIGSENDYMPVNQSKSEGNDDQSTWALAAMTAAEYGFPSDVLKDLDTTTWVDLAIAVFNSQAARWDEETCNGGLRWQIFSFNNGYNYKNSMTNGNFYQLASRLARFTANNTYADWGERVQDWTFEVGLIGDANSTRPGAVYDGSDSSENCSTINHIQWTASIGTYLAGSAYAYNHTPTAVNLGYRFYVPVINSTFASGTNGSSANGTITEVACANNCNTDQLAFRAVLARALAQTRALVPETPLWTNNSQINVSDPYNISASQDAATRTWSIRERIDFMLQQSAKGAAEQCSGGKNGTTCGSDWASSEWDGTEGLGQDLSALNIILANIPITEKLATTNQSAAAAGGSGGTVGNTNGTTSGADGANSAGTDGAPASEGAASSIVMSTMGLTAAVGSMIVVFL